MLTDRRMDDGVTGILIAHLGAFGSGELKIEAAMMLWIHHSPCKPGVTVLMTGFSSLSDETFSCVPVSI